MNIRYLFPSFIWAITIIVLILMPSDNIPKTKLLNIPHIDKFIHFGLFFVLSILLDFGFRRQSLESFMRKNHYTISLIFCVIFGVGTELLQFAFTSQGRSATVLDFLANFAGALAGVFALFLLIKIPKIDQFIYRI
ncbi:MAG: VanZ family protein [Bacteroidota bacterium]